MQTCFLPSKQRPQLRSLALGAVALAFGMTSCNGPKPKSEIVVSVKDQRMGIYRDGVLRKQYKVSTSKFGLGDRPGSNCTPLGKHQIVAKIGHKLPVGAVMHHRVWSGEVIKPNAPGRDPIVSRILWLSGLEQDNRNAQRRYIYIHGTPEEARLGTPASYGCIRMGMKDVVNLFEDTQIGAKVTITKGRLPRGEKVEEEMAPADSMSVANQPPILLTSTPNATAPTGSIPQASTAPSVTTPTSVTASSAEKPASPTVRTAKKVTRTRSLSSARRSGSAPRVHLTTRKSKSRSSTNVSSQNAKHSSNTLAQR
jgi:L,D-transpeptidase catalytic domain